jgi:hypothetical protein
MSQNPHHLDCLYDRYLNDCSILRPMDRESPMKTDTPTLIKAMRLLASEIESDDGTANAAISEAADRIEELQADAADQAKWAKSYLGRAEKAEAELAALRAKVDLLTHQNAGLCAVLHEAGAPADPANAFEMAAWAQGVAALRADKERLDWLEEFSIAARWRWIMCNGNPRRECVVSNYFEHEPFIMGRSMDGLRAAIDAAKAGREGGAK